MDSQVLVRLNNVFYKYAQNWTLKNFNLEIHKNTIYSLLGPSGAGKTTVIGIILRELQPQFGEIDLNGITSRKHFGYMPQNPSLFDDLTIKESLVYYSYLNGLGGSIPDKTKQLLDMLEIKNLDILTSHLSGGQQRRVSFVLTLIHEPHFLLLDEPTASLDCLHSQSIWKYLLNLTEKGTTILLTTHYVQEAINSTQIGFLRKGKIIIEGDPASIIDEHGTNDFEDIFLKLSLMQENFKDDKDIENDITMKKYDPINHFEDDKTFKFCSFKAQLLKNAIWAKRNIPMVLCHFMLPFIMVSVYGIAFGTDPVKINVGILSSVNTSCTNTPLDYNELLRCTLPLNYECFIYKRLEEKFKIKGYEDFDVAQSDLTAGKINAVMVIESNFSSSLTDFYSGSIHFDENNRVIIDENASIVAYVDNSDYVIRFFLKTFINKSVLGVFKDIEEFCKTNKPGKVLPMRFEKPIYGNEEMTFSESSYPNFMCALCFGFTIIFSTPILLVEKKGGFFKRNLISGLTYIEMIGAHTVMQLALCVLQDLSFLMMGIVFDFPNNGHFLAKLSVMLACNLTGMAFGFLCGEAFTSDFLVMLTSLGVMNTIMMLGGTLWPLAAFPKWMLNIIQFLPFTKSGESMTALLIKNFSVTHFIVYRTYIEAVFWILFCSVLCNYSYKRNKVNTIN